jgi:type II secretion system protein C
MVKKLLLGLLYSVVLAFLVAKSANFFLVVEKDVEIKINDEAPLDMSMANAINIKDEIKVEKKTTQTNYINSWKLMATIVGDNSYALVVREKKSKVLRIDSMIEGYKVKKIEKDKILCSSPYTDTWLHMKKVTVQSNGQVAQAPDPTSFTLRRAMVDTKLRRPDELLQEINIKPLLHNNRFDGLKVSYIREGGFLYNYGLRIGDVITKFNGKRLNSLSDGINVYQKVLNAQKFSVTIKRKNREKELFYEVR